MHEGPTFSRIKPEKVGHPRKKQESESFSSAKAVPRAYWSKFLKSFRSSAEKLL